MKVEVSKGQVSPSGGSMDAFSERGMPSDGEDFVDMVSAWVSLCADQVASAQMDSRQNLMWGEKNSPGTAREDLRRSGPEDELHTGKGIRANRGATLETFRSQGTFHGSVGASFSSPAEATGRQGAGGEDAVSQPAEKNAFLSQATSTEEVRDGTRLQDKTPSAPSNGYKAALVKTSMGGRAHSGAQGDSSQHGTNGGSQRGKGASVNVKGVEAVGSARVSEGASVGKVSFGELPGTSAASLGSSSQGVAESAMAESIVESLSTSPLSLSSTSEAGQGKTNAVSFPTAPEGKFTFEGKEVLFRIIRDFGSNKMGSIEFNHPEFGTIRMTLEVQEQNLDLKTMTQNLASALAIRSLEDSLRQRMQTHELSLRKFRVNIEGSHDKETSALERNQTVNRRYNRSGGRAFETEA